MENRPYVVCSPHYVPNCGGIKSLHALCSAINNREGHTAYITSNRFPPELNCKKIEDCSGEYLRYLQYNGIIIYPDIVPENPARFNSCVKFWLGATQVPTKAQLNISFSKMHEVVHKCEYSLFIWYIEDFFKEPYPLTNRIKSCCYAGKGSGIDHSAVVELTGNANNSVNPSGCIRITGYYPSPRTALVKLLQESKVFFCYDNLTIMMTEARLCGTPVVLMGHWVLPREDFVKRDEFGLDGICLYGEEEIDLEKLKSQLTVFRERYELRKQKTEKELDIFLEVTQNWNKENKYVDNPGPFAPTLNGIQKLALWATR